MLPIHFAIELETAISSQLLKPAAPADIVPIIIYILMPLTPVCRYLQPCGLSTWQPIRQSNFTNRQLRTAPSLRLDYSLVPLAM
ncbi:MAG: hypothetical protein H6Q69_2519 [Firmicutes bacterium]|nr:hypothetical protein [Bacillota bacterium]